MSPSDPYSFTTGHHCHHLLGSPGRGKIDQDIIQRLADLNHREAFFLCITNKNLPKLLEVSNSIEAVVGATGILNGHYKIHIFKAVHKVS